MGEPFMRKRMYEKYTEHGFELATFIHPLAFVSDSSIIDEGCIILPFSYVAQNTKLGKNIIVHSGGKIENDCTIGDNCFIGAGSIVTKDIPPYAIVGGIPARIIKYRYNQEDIDFLLRVKWWNKDEEWLIKHSHLFLDIDNFKRMIKTNE
jgi:carbonic anhydrase/acetyltransferase-like protein (isoleucine patch superfamily)